MTLRAIRVPVLCFVLVRTVSTLGSMASALAVLVWVQQLTGSNGAAALSMFLFAFPSLVYPVIGELVDAFDRVLLLVIGQLIGAALISGLLLVQDASDVWMIYAIQLLQGVNTGLIMVSSDTILPKIADKDEFAAVNGIMQSCTQSARLLAPIIGVLCYTQFGGIAAVVVLDVSSFALGILLLVPVGRASARRKEAGHAAGATGTATAPRRGFGIRRAWNGYLNASRQGIVLINAHPGVRLMVVTAGCCILSVGLLSSAWYAVITEGLHRPASFAGVLASAQAAGGVAGGLAGVWFAARSTRTQAGCRLALVLIGAAAVSCLSGRPVAVTAGSLAIGFGGTVLVVVYATLIQSSVPEDSLGRVFAGMDAVVNLMQVGGLALGAAWLAASPDLFEPIVALAAMIIIPGLILTTRIGSPPETPRDGGTSSTVETVS